MMNVEEFKAILKIVPTDDLTAMRICDRVEKFREKHPRVYAKVMEETLQKMQVEKEDVQG